jgi:hypothetical protein
MFTNVCISFGINKTFFIFMTLGFSNANENLNIFSGRKIDMYVCSLIYCKDVQKWLKCVVWAYSAFFIVITFTKRIKTNIYMLKMSKSKI